MDSGHSLRSRLRLPRTKTLSAVLLGLCAVLLIGGVLIRTYQVRHLREQQAIADIRAMGGSVFTTVPSWLPHPLFERRPNPLERVDFVNLFGKPVYDEDLRRLSHFTGLRHLDLRNTQIGDAGLAQLSEFRNLCNLYLDGTQVTQQGVDELKSKLPHCNIVVRPLSP